MRLTKRNYQLWVVAAALAAASQAFALVEPFSAEELSSDSAFGAACARRMQTWKARRSAIKPDYSDSSRYLEPPQDNRLDAPFKVVSGGKPAATIVLESASSEDIVLRRAAEELAGHIKLITGVELKICDFWGARDDKRDRLNRICIGKRLIPCGYSKPSAGNAWLQRLAETDGGCGKDGFAIRLDPERPTHLHVFGTTSKGTMNGVFALLENNTDIIWARPNEEIGTVFTPSPGELSFVWGKDFVSVPDTVARGWNSYAGLEWMSRNGCNLFNGGGGGDISHVNAKKGRYGVWSVRHIFGHMFSSFLANETDPLVFANDGHGVPFPEKRKMPCFTYPKALDVFSDRLINCARLAPAGTERLYVSMEDTMTTCACSNCLAPIKLPDGTVLTKEDDAFFSMRFWTFMNKAVRRLNAVFPQMKVDTLAYFYTAPVPPCDIDTNLTPEFAPYVRANDKDPIFAPENAKWLRRLAGWRGKCGTVEMYDYHGLGIRFPRPLAETRAFDFAVMNPYVVGMTSENNTMSDKTVPNSPWGDAEAVWDVSAMEQWVITRLYWNCRRDVEGLRKYFIRRAYREAAPEVERVYGMIRDEWFASPARSTLGDDPVELAKSLIVARGRDAELAAYLDRAVAAARHPKAKVLVERLRQRLMSLVADAKSIKNPKIALPLVRVDGAPGFDDAVWRQSAKFQPFTVVDRRNRGRPAASATQMLAFPDTKTLYLKFRCEDRSCAQLPVIPVPPDGKERLIVADHLEVFVDDPTQAEEYFLFGVAPDAQRFDWRKNAGIAWNGEWDAKTRRDAGGWEAVVSIPLKTLNVDILKNDALRLLAVREVHSHGELKAEFSSWGGGGHHQRSLFGDVKLMH